MILLTTFDDTGLALRAIEAGARGFLLKDASPLELVETIEEVAAGRTLVAPIATDAIRERYAYRDGNLPAGRFNRREIDVLRLLAGGYTNREIGQAIHVTEGTVKNYLMDIFDKLGARDRTRAVLKAITLKIILTPGVIPSQGLPDCHPRGYMYTNIHAQTEPSAKGTLMTGISTLRNFSENTQFQGSIDSSLGRTDPSLGATRIRATLDSIDPNRFVDAGKERADVDGGPSSPGMVTSAPATPTR